MDAIDLVVAEVVRTVVRDSGLSHEVVAEFVGISHASWRGRMQGKSPFAVHELGRIARLLDIELATLVDVVAEQVS